MAKTPDVESPQTRYAKSGDVHVASQVFGEGPLDFVYIPNAAHHVELNRENPPVAQGMTRRRFILGLER